MVLPFHIDFSPLHGGTLIPIEETQFLYSKRTSTFNRR